MGGAAGHADETLLPYVAVMSAIESLHRMTREERDLDGADRSREAITSRRTTCTPRRIRACGYVGEVYGLPRHLFDERIEEWAERRGVLVKAIEDAALAMASVYRSVGLPLPRQCRRRATRAARVRRAGRANHAVRPGDRRGDGRRGAGAGVTSSVCGSWGAVAGTLRYFADRWGVPRAAIEGTQIPKDLIRKYATRGAGTLVYQPRRHGAPYAMEYPVVYRGFELEREREAADGDATAGGRRPTQA